jgi:AbrB family looped-hinge helix DNA binding protein
METTRLSSKGRVILPKSIREAHKWGPGTEFTVEETADGVPLLPARHFPKTRLEDVAGCLKWHGEPKTIVEMKEGIAREIRRRHERDGY